MSGSLRIRILEGRQMVPMDSTGTSDPFVKVKFEGETKETRVCHRTLNPKWDSETFVFLHRNPVNTVKFEVYDHDTLGANDFMGMAEMQFGTGAANSGCVWVALKPREGNKEDETIAEKYGGLGEIKVDYSHTYFALSKYLASDHLIGQLEKKVDGRLFAKRQEGTPNLDAIERDMARLSLHARNFTAPLIWVKDHVTGYRIAYEEGKAEAETILVDEHRIPIFVAVTVIAILGYIPFWVAERLSRAALPAMLLILFRRGAGYDRSAFNEKENPFLFLQSPACFNVFFGVDQSIFEKRFIGKAVGAVGSAFTTTIGGIGNAMGAVTQATKNSMKFTKAESVRSTSRYSYMSHQTTSDLSEASDDGVSFEYEKPTAEELKTSTNNIAPYIGLAAEKAMVYHQTVSWQRQHTAAAVLKRAVILLLILLYLPTPPLAPAAWCIFTYIFFVPRLYYTNKKLYDTLNIGTVLGAITHGIEWVIRKALRMSTPEEKPEDDQEVTLHVKQNKFNAGDKVEVTLEVEQPNGEWKVTYSDGVVVDDDGAMVTVDWGDGSPHFRIEQGHVKMILEQETAPPYTIGETVKVTYEKEEPSGEWKLTHGIGSVKRITSDYLEIDWNDGSPTYNAPLSTVTKQEGLAEHNEADLEGLRKQIGKRVMVKIEVEAENGDWVMKEEEAKLHAIEGTDALIDWDDGDSMYRCSVEFVKPVEEGTPSEASDAGSMVVEYEPATGHVVSVNYDVLEDGEWVNQQANAKVIDVHPEEKRVTVEWEEHEGETYTCAMEHVKFVSETIEEDTGKQEPAAAFVEGERVVVTFERELDEPDNWAQAHDIGTIKTIAGEEATITWEDEPDSTPFTITLSNLTKINKDFRPGSRVAFSCEAEHSPSSWTSTTETGTLLSLTETTATIDLGEHGEPGAQPYETPIAHLISVI
eukprot:TRINITY_DN1265_c0_g1_i11.p1 TRINITY_DN1265_c0_g1~~TRINITY_DN1265_c0_g1_i11.p1  ORF type:complete len:924 (+),score=217.59 TRINITY_DN1265_c0_g1_i11:73-2844(+)